MRYRRNAPDLKDDALLIAGAGVALWLLWPNIRAFFASIGTAIGHVAMQPGLAAGGMNVGSAGTLVISIPNGTAASPGNATPGYTLDNDGSVIGPDGNQVVTPDGLYMATVNPYTGQMQDEFGKPMLVNGVAVTPGWVQYLPPIAP